jgi:hypothetical protein
MNDERLMVAQAVIDGAISAEYLTNSELAEIEIQVQEFCMQREMDAATERGCLVFDGVEGDPVH